MSVLLIELGAQRSPSDPPPAQLIIKSPLTGEATYMMVSINQGRISAPLSNSQQNVTVPFTLSTLRDQRP